MKFMNALLLAAGASIGTAAIIDKRTGGSVRYMIDELKNSIEDDFDDEVYDDGDDEVEAEDTSLGFTLTAVDVNNNGFDILMNPETLEKSVIMPLNDAINLYQCIEDSISDTETDIELYGDKALSFEKLYDLLEDELGLLDSPNNEDTPKE